jgi:hypothetical protein
VLSHAVSNSPDNNQAGLAGSAGLVAAYGQETRAHTYIRVRTRGYVRSNPANPANIGIHLRDKGLIGGVTGGVRMVWRG